jgi:hypothetical protein
MRSWRPFCCGWPGRQLGEVEEGIRAGERDAIVGADGTGQTAFAKQLLEGGDGEVLAGRFQGLAHQQEARGVVGHREGIAVAPVAELELALEIGAPEIVGGDARRQWGAAGMLPSAQASDQAVAVEHGVDGALGRHAKVAVEPAHQEFADLARTPVRLAALAFDDQGLDLRRQLVGIADRAPRAVTQGFQPVLLVATEDLVAGLARDAELAADLGHRLALQQAGDKPQTFVHYRTLLPRHPPLPQG